MLTFYLVSLNDLLVIESIIADNNVVGVIGIMECKYNFASLLLLLLVLTN